MARPRKEGMDYFPHDTDAANDEKVEALRALYGNDGYAFYFILLERIYRTREYEIDVSDAEMIQILARKVAVTPEKLQQMINTALKWGAFDQTAYKDRGVLTSNGVKKRASVVEDRRRQMRVKYRQEQDQDDPGIVSDAETPPETTQKPPRNPGFCGVSFSRESKVKESKEEKSSQKDPPLPIQPKEIIALWNEICSPPLPKVIKLTDGRRRKMLTRITQEPDRGHDWWRSYFDRIRGTPFLTGTNDRNWVANFDFAVSSEENVAKILEGAYDRAKGKNGAQYRTVDDLFKASEGG